jgi:hypothetical protein
MIYINENAWILIEVNWRCRTGVVFGEMGWLNDGT